MAALTPASHFSADKLTYEMLSTKFRMLVDVLLWSLAHPPGHPPLQWQDTGHRHPEIEYDPPSHVRLPTDTKCVVFVRFRKNLAAVTKASVGCTGKLRAEELTFGRFADTSLVRDRKRAGARNQGQRGSAQAVPRGLESQCAHCPPGRLQRPEHSPSLCRDRGGE
jgi:hypothetical protein